MSTTKPTYATTVTVTGGRQGHAVSDDGVLDIQLRLPKLNGVSDGTNPEQLFAAAWGGCFQSALLGLARHSGADASNSSVTVEVTQAPNADGRYALGAKIMVEIPGMDRERAQQLADAAHEVCPYSNATRGNIEVEVSAV